MAWIDELFACIGYFRCLLVLPPHKRTTIDTFARIMLENGFTAAVLNTVNKGRFDFLSAIHKHSIRTDHFQQGRFARAQRISKQRRHIIINAKAFGEVRDDIHAQIVSQTDSHQVSGFFDTDTNGGRAVIFVGIVCRAPEITGAVFDNKWCIQNKRGRCKAIDECRQIHERFKGRTGLALRLRCAVEFGASVAVVPPALHCQNTSSVRVHSNDRALYFGDLLKTVMRAVLIP